MAIERTQHSSTRQLHVQNTNLCWLVGDLVRGTPDHSVVVGGTALGFPGETDGCLDWGVAKHQLLVILGGSVEADLQQASQVQFDWRGGWGGRGRRRRIRK